MAIFTGMFYPRITYGLTPTVLDFGSAALHDGPARDVAVESVAVRGDNISANGLQESLHTRTEYVLTLFFTGMTSAKAAELWTYIDTWGNTGKPAAIILDRLNTCAGQLEYDLHNARFTRAKLLKLRNGVTRIVRGRALYGTELTWRQDAG